jgi:hypothetical protein
MKEEIIQILTTANTAQLDIIRILLQKPYDAELCEIIHKILKQS